MKQQKSFHDSSDTGGLYIVPTPIGNLEDITIRSLKILEEATIIAAEDTRNTGKLLHHFKIENKMISYHEHNKDKKEPMMLDYLRNGHIVAVVSDAGMPGISDPGYELITAAIQEDVPVIVLPGANAALCALVGSGLPTNEFFFYGFLPRKKNKRLEEIERIRSYQSTIMLYESPYRVKETVTALREGLGNRRVTLARELTKRYEEYVRGTLEELENELQAKEVKGECCLIIEGASDTETYQIPWWDSFTLQEHVEAVMAEEACSSKEAIKKVAKTRNLSKRDVYQAYHVD
ncbi:16S rRNA cytidine-2'-O-methyltransferase RsmI [Gracilibacillus halophilus YIM-C55.5]|uniref:Ribosomal RNA small subunit methyltransferase I n=1 Tax=Gracilibacillus halophilus YIM-C55.5 TaxID=1308866 RepID=N4WA35_9BACI|nr:16S rRNA (cytidine(1402)-2'-O)-methyltransferase [Gracilibacillus halophilus]ENH96114.1 16S rRNA cytidine-2'-O-methyltransferase RsmI [Gracilibacillus halophilus YIM-C55.5]